MTTKVIKKEPAKPKKLSKIGEFMKSNNSLGKIVDMKAVMK